MFQQHTHQPPWFFMHRGHHERACAGGPRGEGRGGPFAEGRGGPFGRHRGGPFGGHGRGPRMFDPGALRIVVLGLIADEPRHGYDIIKALEARFQGAYSPSPGAIYPMLQMLEEADLVTSTTTGNKRLYSITEAGRTWLTENRAELDKINAQLDEASSGIGQAAIAQEVQALRHAIFHRLRSGALSKEQAEKLRAALRAARETIDSL